MATPHHPRSIGQLFVLATALLLCISGLNSTSGQIPNLAQFTSPNRAPNPLADLRRIASKRPDSRPRRTSSNLPKPSPDARTDEKQQAIEQAISEGNEARDKNDYEQALAHYQKIVKDLNPKEARAFYGMGNLYSDLYCHDSAIVAYVEALKLKKDYPEALIGLGYAYFGKERYDEAGVQFQDTLKLKPNSVEANIGLGYVYAKKRKYQEAVALMDLVINASGAEDKDRAAARLALGVVYWFQEKPQEAITQFEQAISLNPNLARAYVDLGNAQMSAGFSKLANLGFSNLKDTAPQDREALHAAAKEATANFEKARQRFNYNHPNLYLSLGIALAYQLRYQEAATQLNDYFAEIEKLKNRLSPIASKCDGGFNRLNAEGYWHLGFIYHLESLFEANEQRKIELANKALEQLNQAVKLKQDYAPVYGLLGAIYWSQKKYDDAISQFQKAILFTADDSAKANLYSSLGSVYLQKGNKDEGLKHVREAIRLSPNNPSFYETLASIYVGQDKLEETLEALNKATALRTEPTANPGPYHYLGVTYAIRFMHKRNEKDFEEAIRWLKKAVETRPNDAMYHRALGMTYRSHSDADEALASYKKAIENDPKNAGYYYDLADIYANLKNNKEAAIEALKKAIELKPDYAEAYRFWGVMSHRKDNDDEAVKQLLKAIEIDPKLLPANLDLAFIYKIQKNYPEAIKYLNKATEIAPTDFYPYKELAKVYEEQRNIKEAVHYYEEASNRLKADDTSTKDLYLGRIARLQGRYADAIGYFQKVSFPDEPGQSHYEIGLTHVASKNKSAALEQYQQLVQLKSPLAEELLKKIKEMK